MVTVVCHCFKDDFTPTADKDSFVQGGQGSEIEGGDLGGFHGDVRNLEREIEGIETDEYSKEKLKGVWVGEDDGVKGGYEREREGDRGRESVCGRFTLLNKQRGS